MSTPPLPVELLHEILESLRSDIQTLRQCALACSTLRYVTQQHLFSELSLHRFSDHDHEETRCAWLLKPAHSHLLSHVRHLKIQSYPPPAQSSSTSSTTTPSTPDPFFLAVLDHMPVESIHKITILRRYRDNPLLDTEKVVTRLLRRCTAIRELSLEDRRVPAAYLAAVAGSIRVLRVHGTEFVVEKSAKDDDFVVGSWPRLEALMFPGKLSQECLSWMVVVGSGSGDGGVGIDVGVECVFPRLKTLFVGDECKDVEVVNEVLQMSKSTLRSFVYTPYCYNFSSYPNPCFNQNGTVIEFTTPPTLRTLAINCPVMLKPASHNYPNPFGWLNYTIRNLSRQNQPSSLEKIHIKFLTTEQIEKLDAIFPGKFPVDMCFHEFDKLLTDKRRFPRLKKVYLTVGRHYLALFRDPETLPILNMLGLLGIVFQEISSKKFWLCAPGPGNDEMERLENLPWDGRVCEFV